MRTVLPVGSDGSTEVVFETRLAPPSYGSMVAIVVTTRGSLAGALLTLASKMVHGDVPHQEGVSRCLHSNSVRRSTRGVSPEVSSCSVLYSRPSRQGAL